MKQWLSVAAAAESSARACCLRDGAHVVGVYTANAVYCEGNCEDKQSCIYTGILASAARQQDSQLLGEIEAPC